MTTEPIEHVSLPLNERQYALLNRLHSSGLYGQSIEDTVLRLVDQKLNDLVHTRAFDALPGREFGPGLQPLWDSYVRHEERE